MKTVRVYRGKKLHLMLDGGVTLCGKKALMSSAEPFIYAKPGEAISDCWACEVAERKLVKETQPQ